MPVKRCIHLDWLEVHCLEPSFTEPRDANYFRGQGWVVREREYGTRVYEQMFTLMQHGTSEPLLEIRRLPVTNKSKGLKVLEPLSCHIRLCNRSCYLPSPAAIMFEFISRYNFTFRRISRVDLALDFERFDSGDWPDKFILRYLRGTYRKMNVTTIHSHGEDIWEGQKWNSISWGSKSSMVSTKLYNKTLELKQVKDKPYIRQAWLAAGLVDDFWLMNKTAPDGTVYNPQIWRLEFSVQSSARGWFRIEDDTTKDGIRSMKNTLDCYFSDKQCLDIFASLAEHYFHFKLPAWVEKTGQLQRKDRCPDKVLFRWDKEATFYKVERVTSSSTIPNRYESLIRRLQEYRDQNPKPEVITACNQLIEDMRHDSLYYATARPYDLKERQYLQLLLNRRLSASDEPFSLSLEEIRAFIEIGKGF